MQPSPAASSGGSCICGETIGLLGFWEQASSATAGTIPDYSGDYTVS